MKNPNTGGYGINLVIRILYCLAVTVVAVVSGAESPAGFYITVTNVPVEYKEKMIGFHVASKDQKISFPFIKAEIAVDKSIHDACEELRGAIQRHHHLKFPKVDVFPGVTIISEADVKEIEGGLIVLGQTRRPGTVPVRNGLTVYQAIQATGGPTQFGSMRNVVVFRSKKPILCDFTKAESFKILSKPGDVVIVPMTNLVPDTAYP